jgi:hypothetical protein
MYSGTNKKNNLIAREARIGAFKIILQSMEHDAKGNVR